MDFAEIKVGFALRIHNFVRENPPKFLYSMQSIMSNSFMIGQNGQQTFAKKQILYRICGMWQLFGRS